MAENETAVAEQETEAGDYQYDIKIEDAGPATKKVSVSIPHDRISTKMTEQFKELRSQAVLPGFRVGHAPQKLIEKRFSQDVREQVRRSLISESYEQAVEKHNLQVLGEPQFDDAESIQLPESGDLSYSFQIEVQPEFTLPNLVGLQVKKPSVEVTEEHVNQAMANLREQQGTLVPVEDRGVEAGDYLVGDVHLKLDGNVVTHQHDAQIVARAGRVGGIEVPDLAEKLAGLKPEERREFTVHAPETHPNEAVRGKDVQLEVCLKTIKKLELAEINDAFLADLGFENEGELREALREQMVERIGFDVQQSMREQVNNYLLQNVQIELPTKMSDRQADRVVQRRAMDLMMRGMPRETVEANVQALRGGAKEEAARELKLFFILQKIAADQNVDVDEGELNGRIAMMAVQQGQRPEKLKQEMTKDGSLSNLYIQMREQKAVDKILESAQIENVPVAGEGAAAPAADAAPSSDAASSTDAAQAPAAEGEPKAE